MEYLLVLRWLLALAALTAVGAPLAAALFPGLPRRGAAFALPTALVSLALVTFWLGRVTYGLHTVLAALLVVALASVAAHRVGPGPGPDWRSVALLYCVFAVGFGIIVLVRAHTYGLTAAGGEKFLHYGLVRSIARAGALPPEDFWFAGEPVQYYYGGQLQIAGLSLLSGTAVRYGFALGNAVFYGVLFVTAYGLAGAVAAEHGRSYHLAGALGAFFAALGGALTTAVRFGFGLLPESVALQYGEPAFGAVRHFGYEEAVDRLSSPAEWGWFYTRYVVPDTLQEFPFYSFVKGDLHGHALTTGLIVFAAALAYSYYRSPADRRGGRLAVLAALGGVAGLFGFMNTWSLPTVVGLTVLAVAAAPAHPATLALDPVARRLRPGGSRADPGALRAIAGECWRVALAALAGGLVGLLGVAIASPFLVFGELPSNEGIGLFPPRSPLSSFLVIYGGLFALFATFLTVRARPALRGRRRSTVAVTALAGLAAVAILVRLDAAVVALTGGVVLAAWWLVRTDRIGFEGVLVAAGVGLLLSMELVHAIVPPFQQVRWNTTLKVAVQGWTLAAVGAGVAAAGLLADVRTRLDGVRAAASAGGTPPSLTSRHTGGRTAVLAALAVGAVVVAVVLTSAFFPAMALANEVQDEDPTLDALGDHEQWRGEELAGYHWLADRPGTPTIVEAPGRSPYTWVNSASTITGLPTVVGWTHQEQYRSPEIYAERADDVDEIYVGDWAAAAAHLQRYEVEYVVVGPPENETYGEDVREFRERDGIDVAFENDAIAIYAVDRSALPEPAAQGDRRREGT